MSVTAKLRQFCTFYLDDQLFGIEVLQVQEVRRTQVMTEVPVAPRVVRGLMNLRGCIVSCIDLRRRFGMDSAPSNVEPIHVITHTTGGLVSFEVDRIGDVVEVAEESFELPPPTMQGNARRLIDGVFKLNKALLQVVNVERVLELDGIHD